MTVEEKQTPIDAQPATGSGIAPELLRAVVKIASSATNHSPNAVGTGFVVSCEGVWKTKEQRLAFLITNKHIIGDWTLADGNILERRRYLEVTFYGPIGGAFTPVTIPLLGQDGNPLPNRLLLAEDNKVDLAAIFLNEIPVPRNLSLATDSFDTSYLLPFSKIQSWFVGLGDQVFALGYPYGIALAKTSYPIAKAGYLATVPGQEFSMDLPCESRNGEQRTVRLEGRLLVIDGLIVPGNSGGPVVVPSDLKVRRDPDTKQLQFATEQRRNFVIGVVSTAIGSSGLTLVYGCDYVLELVGRFAHELEDTM